MPTRLFPSILGLLLASTAACSTTVKGGSGEEDVDDDASNAVAAEGEGGNDDGEGGDDTTETTTGGHVGDGGAGGAVPGVCDLPPPADLADCEERGSDGNDGAGGWISYSLWCDDETGWRCEMDETPLVLSFDGADVTYATAERAGFDLTGDGVSMASDWPAAKTPWLALDRDGDGSIAGGAELFGSAVRLASGRKASHGFEALAELDGNGDGRIDAADPRFGELRVWADVDADRATDAGELASAASGARRIVSIDLGYHVRRTCDARGNCGIERAAFVWADAAGAEHVGEVVDVHLPRR